MKGNITGEDVARLTQSFALAAVNPAQWLPAMSLLSDTVGAVCCALELTDLNTGAAVMECSIDLDEEVLHNYEERIFHINPRISRAMALPLGSVVDDRHVMSIDDPNAAEFLDWLGKTPYHYIQGGKLLDARGQIGFFTSNYSKKHGPPNETQERVHRLLFPHLINVLEVGRALSGGRLHNQLLDHQGLDGDRPFALLDRAGHLLECSPGFEVALGSSGLLALQGRKLTARHFRHRKAVDLLMKAVAGDGGGLNPPLPVRLTGPNQLKGIVLRAVALPPNGDVFDLFRPGALVTLTDLDSPHRARVTDLIALFGFTGREAQVASLVGQGLPIEQVANSLSISTYTARQHLKAVFGKSGISRQAELVAIISRLG